MKHNRIFSYLMITLVYLLAIVVGVVVYNSLHFHFAVNLLIADVVATIVVFFFSLVFQNASVYDPYWSVQPLVIVFLFFLQSSKGIV